MAAALLLGRIVHHGGGHTLGRAITDADHATGTEWLFHFAVPGQAGETHEPVLHRRGFLNPLPKRSGLRVLASYRIVQAVHRGFQGDP